MTLTHTQREDIKTFASGFELADMLQGSTLLITGGTGLIGSMMIHCLLALGRDIHIIAPVRNMEKAHAMLDGYGDELSLVECDLTASDFSFAQHADYIIHCAAPTSSHFFVEHPLETYNSIVQPTQHLLEYACKHAVRGFAYLSSLEVYGKITDGTLSVTEDMQGLIAPFDARSSYPLGKRSAEHLCYLYAHEHGVPVTIVRLTQTTGAGVSDDDNRVIVAFNRQATAGKDIILHTKGESARPYCYLTDTISAILYIMLRGNAGEAYNVANDDTYCSARELADMIRETVNPGISVRVEIKENTPYPAVSRLRLDTSKTRSLGWKPTCGMRELCLRLSRYLLEKEK